MLLLSVPFVLDYLSQGAVKRALHMVYTNPATNETDVLLKGQKWEECSNDIFEHWPTADTYSDTVALYQEIHAQVMQHRRGQGFKMLVYSGDADGVCATMGTEHWIFNVTKKSIWKEFNGTVYAGFADPAQSPDSQSAWYCNLFPGKCSPKAPFTRYWEPWHSYGRTAGYLTTLSPVFAFATVIDAGHEVPAYQPAAGLVLLKNFLGGNFFTEGSHSSSRVHSSRTLLSETADSMGGLVASRWEATASVLYGAESEPLLTQLEVGLAVATAFLLVVLLKLWSRMKTYSDP
jgi:hypothetical protein